HVDANIEHAVRSKQQAHAIGGVRFTDEDVLGTVDVATVPAPACHGNCLTTARQRLVVAHVDPRLFGEIGMQDDVEHAGETTDDGIRRRTLHRLRLQLVIDYATN